MNFHDSITDKRLDVSMQDGDVILEDEKCSLLLIASKDKIIYTPFHEHVKKQALKNKEMESSDQISTNCAEDSAMSNIASTSSLEGKPMKILPKKIAFNKLQICEITSTVNPSEFYIQREVDHESIVEMIKIIEKHCDVPGNSINPVIGNIYLGRFTSDDNWYRAKLLDRDEEKFMVYYIDYSNKETLDISRLRDCPEELLHVPEFAIRCSLHDLQPIDGDCWSREAIDMFSKITDAEISKSEVMIYNIEEIDSSHASYVCHVELITEHLMPNASHCPAFSIRNALSFMGYALLHGQPFIYEEPGVNFDKYDRAYSMPEITFHKKMTVKPGKIHTPWAFYLLEDSERMKYELEFNALQVVCKENDVLNNVQWMIFYPVKGMICTVMINGKWHRGLVKKVIGNGMVKVLNVDTGNEGKISYKSLRRLPDSFSRFPVQAIKASLPEIFPIGGQQDDEWTKEAIAFFTKCLNNSNHQLKASVFRRTETIVDVDLTSFDGNKVADISRLLIDNNYCTTIGEKFQPVQSGYLDLDPHEDKSCASMQKIKRRLPSDPDEMQTSNPLSKVAQNLKGINLKDNKRIHITFLGLVSPDLIYVTFNSQDVCYRAVHRRLWTEFDRFKKVDPLKVKVGGVYVVEYKTKDYARVKILNIENNQCRCQLIDLGGVKLYAVEQLRVVDEMLEKTKGFAVIIKLANIIPTCGKQTWPQTTIDYLTEILSTKEDPFIIKCGVASKNPNYYGLKVLPVLLGWVDVIVPSPFEPSVTIYRCVNQLLTNSGLALPDRSYVKCLDLLDESNSEVSTSEPDVSKKCIEEIIFSAPRVPVKTWLPAEILTGQKYYATIANVDDNCNIFFQLRKHERLLNQMTETYEYKFADSHQTNNDLLWFVTSPIIAKYHADKNWYRAVVRAVNEKSIHVEFVDFGNKDDILVTDIRAADDLYMKTPVMCYVGQLSEIEPLTPRWEVKELDFIHHVTVEQRVEITLLEPHVPGQIMKLKVLLLDTNQDLAEFLVSIGRICRFTNGKPAPNTDFPVFTENLQTSSVNSSRNKRTLCDRTPDVDVDQRSNSHSSFPETIHSEENMFEFPNEAYQDDVDQAEVLIDAPILDFGMTRLKFPSNRDEVFPVKLTRIVNLRHVFVSPYVMNNDSTETEFTKQLGEAIAELPRVMQATIRLSQQTGPIADYSKAIYICQEEGEWLRICVIGVYEDDVKVRFIDNGTEKYVSKSEIKTVQRAAYDIPPLALPVSILDVESQALRSLHGNESYNSIIEHVQCMGLPIFASLVENRRIPVLNLFINVNGKRCNLFEYLNDI